MDPQLSLGFLAAGAAAGFLWKPSLPENPAVTCHCDCSNSGEPQEAPGKGYGILELLIICVLCFLLGALSFLIIVKVDLKHKPSHQALVWPAKGKGKRGVFGVASSAPSSD